MRRWGWRRLLTAGVVVVWACLFFHWDNTEKSMVRALLVETQNDGWTVGLLYQFPEASADSSEAEASIRLCTGRGDQLAAAIAAAEDALPQRADWRLCEYLLVTPDSLRKALPACEELYLSQPYGRLASRVFGADFSPDALEERAEESEALPEELLQCVKNAAHAAPRLYEQSRGILLPVTELEEEGAHCKPEALILTAEQAAYLTAEQTEMALFLLGRSWTNASGHLFWQEGAPLRLRRAICGVERENEGFRVHIDALCKGRLPEGAERKLGELCVDTVSHCWALGLDILGLGAFQGQQTGELALTTKNVCPKIQADVMLF